MSVRVSCAYLRSSRGAKPLINKLDRVYMGMACMGMNMDPKTRPTNRGDPTIRDYPTIQDGANDHPTTPDKSLPSRIPVVLASKGMLILRLEPR